MTSGAIGIFDSGVGGLSVAREVRARLPQEDVLFIADSGHIPYGAKSPDYIRQRSLTLGRFSVARGIKAIVVACNTATAAAAGILRSTFSVPVVAMEPAVKPASSATQSGVVGVLATVGTLQSARFAGLLEHFGQHIKVVTQPAPGLVEQVEAGDLNGEATRGLVERYTQPLLEAGVDTIVLGCTHYPFLRELIADAVGPQVALIDTGAAVARQVERVLRGQGLENGNGPAGTEQFWTSGELELARRVVPTLWGYPVSVAPLPIEFA